MIAKKFLLISAFFLCLSATSCEWAPIVEEVHDEDITLVDPGSTNVVDGVTVIVPASSKTITMTRTNAMVNPLYSQAIGVAQGANSLNPTPTAPLITLGLGALSFILGVIVKIKNKKAGLVDVLVEGVEKANSPEVKAAIRAAAVQHGVGPELHKIVKSNT